MNSISRDEFLKMQESAVEHAKLMQSQASIKGDEACKNTHDFSLNQSDKESNKNYKNPPQSCFVPSYSQNINPNHNIFPNIKNSFDDEESLLLSFILILIFDKADKILIFALIYIMM